MSSQNSVVLQMLLPVHSSCSETIAYYIKFIVAGVACYNHTGDHSLTKITKLLQSCCLWNGCFKTVTRPVTTAVLKTTLLCLDDRITAVRHNQSAISLQLIGVKSAIICNVFVMLKRLTVINVLPAINYWFFLVARKLLSCFFTLLRLSLYLLISQRVQRCHSNVE